MHFDDFSVDFRDVAAVFLYYLQDVIAVTVLQYLYFYRPNSVLLKTVQMQPISTHIFSAEDDEPLGGYGVLVHIPTHIRREIYPSARKFTVSAYQNLLIKGVLLCRNT